METQLGQRGWMLMMQDENAEIEVADVDVDVGAQFATRKEDTVRVYEEGAHLQAGIPLDRIAGRP